MQKYPRVGVGVVVFKEDTVLLIQRGTPPMVGGWSIPGGKQELGEVLPDTARREVREETGILIDEPQLIETLDLIEKNDEGVIEYHYTLIDFTANWIVGELKAGDDAQQAKWVKITELETYQLWGETARVIKLAVSIRG